MADDTQIEAQRELGRRVRAARALAGMDRQSDLATYLGWQPDKIWRIEVGRQVPDALELAAIAKATGQSLDFFLGTASSPKGDDDRGDRVVLDQALAVKAGNR